MNKCSVSVIITLLLTVTTYSQNSKLISGPWAGNVELRTASVWLEVTSSVKKVALKYYPKNQDLSKPQTITVNYSGMLGRSFNPVRLDLNNLEFGTTYQYDIYIDGKKAVLPFETKFTTKDLWQWRKPVPEFSFLTGSCAYFNESQYDRPGKPYGGDSSIFETMANTKADFHIWLGDNWYTREVDYSSSWGLNYRASHDRATPILQKFMASMPQYAIWDDHDFGPNDAGSSYLLKDASREVFNNYWLNPSSGENNKGVYSQFSYGDADFFLTDDRYFRSDPNMSDSINGHINADKSYFGQQQMRWLENALLFSNAPFKIIVTGSQVLNPNNKYECMQEYPAEFNELMDFLSEKKIKGVIFLTGDRHHSEIIKYKRENLYPLYDITVSPYTSGVSKVNGAELNNPYREPNTLIEAQNFAKFSFEGKKGERIMKVEFIGIKGEKLGEWSINEKDIRN